MNELLLEWFMARVKKSMTGCWFWQLGTTEDGYGRCSFLGNIYSTHRLIKYFYGECSITELRDRNIVFMHTCDLPHCVNPAHIKLGTQLDNIADRESKGRGRKGNAVWSARLNPQKVREIRKRAKAGEKYESLAKEFDTSLPNLKAVVYRQKWKHVK